jgi:hypothetical protein
MNQFFQPFQPLLRSKLSMSGMQWRHSSTVAM